MRGSVTTIPDGVGVGVGLGLVLIRNSANSVRLNEPTGTDLGKRPCHVFIFKIDISNVGMGAKRTKKAYFPIINLVSEK